eukprot:6209405-Pleurochrysis_carterae.AAC.2
MGITGSNVRRCERQLRTRDGLFRATSKPLRNTRSQTESDQACACMYNWQSKSARCSMKGGEGGGSRPAHTWPGLGGRIEIKYEVLAAEYTVAGREGCTVACTIGAWIQQVAYACIRAVELAQKSRREYLQRAVQREAHRSVTSAGWQSVWAIRHRVNRHAMEGVLGKHAERACDRRR